MKSFVALFALVAVVAADVSHLESQASIVSQQSEIVHPGVFRSSFETSNGISGQESGVLENVGTDNEGIAVQGSSSYTGPDGKIYTITYSADKNGYVALGDHLPTPPPPQEIPEYIVRSLEYIRAHPPKPEPGQRS